MNGNLGNQRPLSTNKQEISEFLFPRDMDIFLICLILFIRDRIQVTELQNRYID